jgi:hypothetical protein
MTDNEIIKALEYCIVRKCHKCPAKAMFCSANIPMAFALDLINCQKAEIERLTEENKKVSAYIGNGWGYVSFLEFVKTQRVEAIKEFAERLQDRCAKQDGCLWQSDIGAELNEMECENK